MSKKILIDLLKLRDMEACPSDAVDLQLISGRAFKTIRELATFKQTCRKCDDAPCIIACPADALEKEKDGCISRALNLCIRCKSCIASCPFGTIMNDLFVVKTSGINFFNLADDEELQGFVESYPDDVICYTEQEEDIETNVYKLSEKVLVKDFVWDNER